MSRWVMLFVLAGLLLGAFQGAHAQYDTLTVYQIQHVTDPANNDVSPYLGDTVVVKAMVMHGPRDLWVGARWACFVVDPDSAPNPWSGFFVIQHDTFATATNFGFVEAGMICYFTGVVDEFSQLTQLALLTDPPVPVEILSAGNPLPPPVEITAADLAQDVGEQWEAMLVKINNATIVNNNIAGNWASITDPSGATTYIAEYFNWFRDRLIAGTYSWPANGTNLNVIGFVRDESGTPGQVFNVNPRDTSDLEILTNPPVITDVMRNPGVPTSADAVTVSATIVDNVMVQEAKLHYSVNWGPFQQMTMTANVDTFSAVIPAQPNGSFVRYFITAVDNVGDESMFPGDTSMATGSILRYVVRDQGLSIKDVQYTYGYADDASGYEGYEVTLQGIVTTDSTDFSGSYWIQEKDSAWYGIWVRDPDHAFAQGDLVSVTGTVQENFTVTRLNNVTSASLISSGNPVWDPILVQTGEVNTGGAHAEDYESVLIKVENVTVTDPFPDSPNNFGEFVVNDGSGDLRVDDFSSAFRGNLDSTFTLGMQIDRIIALGYYSFGNYKIIPRDTNDVQVVVGIEDSDPLVNEFRLEQNYPNPFNPSTQIRFQVPVSGFYELTVYNLLGQKVRTLINQRLTAGSYVQQWDGRDARGRLVGSGVYFYTLKGEGFQQTRKMLLLK